MKPFLPVIVLLSSLLSGCSGWLNALVPDVYLVDRHTITEADAAGDWPALEQRLREGIHSGPRPFAGMDDNLDQSDSFQVLNDEFTRHPRSR